MQIINNLKKIIVKYTEHRLHHLNRFLSAEFGGIGNGCAAITRVHLQSIRSQTGSVPPPPPCPPLLQAGPPRDLRREWDQAQPSHLPTLQFLVPNCFWKPSLDTSGWGAGKNGMNKGGPVSQDRACGSPVAGRAPHLPAGSKEEGIFGTPSSH